MDEHRRTGRKLMPVVGGIAAAATAVGGWAPVAQVAAAAPDDAPGTDGGNDARQLLDDGTYESCEAYFGWGKDEGVISVVEFDVADTNGDDGTSHTVPDDVDVLLVIEGTGGTVVECVPFQVDEAQWEAEFDGPNDAAWPGTGHYAYPSIDVRPDVEGLRDVESVGFRVIAIPDEHTLVSPTGVQPLASHYFDEFDLFELEVIDDRVFDVVSAQAGPAAAAAFEAAAMACQDDVEYDVSDPDLIEALQFLATYRDDPFPPDEPDEVFCGTIGFEHAHVSYIVGGHATAAYTEPIRLSVPEQPTTTTTTAAPSSTTTTAPGAMPAQAVSARPTFTG